MALRPVITDVFPNYSSLRGGASINILGYNFEIGSRVLFGLQAGFITGLTSTHIHVLSPAQSYPGVYPLTVLSYSGSEWAEYPNFTYVPSFPPGAVRVFAPFGGQVFQYGQQITARWETNGEAVRHVIRLLIVGRNPILLNDRWPGSARSYVFYSPDPYAPSAQATVQVTAYNAVGDSAQGSSQPFTLKGRTKAKEKDKEKEKDKDKEKDKEFPETP